jgi:hypothetical protein
VPIPYTWVSQSADVAEESRVVMTWSHSSPLESCRLVAISQRTILRSGRSGRACGCPTDAGHNESVDESGVRYTLSGDVDICWTVSGSDPTDFVYLRKRHRWYRGSFGARIARLAGPEEVLISRTVHDLLEVSDLEHDDSGVQALKRSRRTARCSPLSEP